MGFCAIALDPDYAAAYHGREHVKILFKDYIAAIQDYDEAIALDPNHAYVYYYREIAKTWLERRLEAKQDFRTALKLAEKRSDTDLKTKIERNLRLLE